MSRLHRLPPKAAPKAYELRRWGSSGPARRYGTHGARTSCSPWHGLVCIFIPSARLQREVKPEELSARSRPRSAAGSPLIHSDCSHACEKTVAVYGGEAAALHKAPCNVALRAGCKRPRGEKKRWVNRGSRRESTWSCQLEWGGGGGGEERRAGIRVRTTVNEKAQKHHSE